MNKGVSDMINKEQLNGVCGCTYISYKAKNQLNIHIPKGSLTELVETLQNSLSDYQIVAVGTYGRYSTKGLFSAVAKVLGVSGDKIEWLTEMMPRHSKSVFAAIMQSIDFSCFALEDYLYSAAVSITSDLEGIFEHSGHMPTVFAIIPKNAPLPIVLRSQAMPNCQFDLQASEKLGYPILNIFELDALLDMQNCLARIKENRGLSIDPDTIPLNDAITYAMIAKSDTAGVFHLDTSRTQQALQKFMPCCFNELMAFIVFNAPKPDKRINDYMNRRRDKQAYPHPILKDILADTYGMIIYHEQTIALLQQISGYNYEEAKHFKRVLIHGKPKDLKLIFETFAAKALENGITEPIINHVLSLLKRYGRAAFPKYHAMTLTKIAYHCAWLKANFSAEFNEIFKDTKTGSKEES